MQRLVLVLQHAIAGSAEAGYAAGRKPNATCKAGKYSHKTECLQESKLAHAVVIS